MDSCFTWRTGGSKHKRKYVESQIQNYQYEIEGDTEYYQLYKAPCNLKRYLKGDKCYQKRYD